MDMIEVKTSELIGSALDWAVAEAEGVRQGTINGEVWRSPHPMCNGDNYEKYSPSTDWAKAGPLIEMHKVSLAVVGGLWYAAFNLKNVDEWDDAACGKTPLIAACRAIVHAKLGETVLVPKELVK